MKKRLTSLLVFCMCFMLLAGCAQAPAPGNPPEQQEKTSKESAQKDAAQPEKAAKTDTRTIVDQAGNTVEIPGKIERVVITSLWPLPSVYVLFQGSADKLVGMHPASLSAAKYSMLTTVAPEVSKVETGFIKNGEINIEELLSLKPDVVLYSATNKAEKEILGKAGIPAVGFSTTIEKFNTVETINSWVELLGEVFQEQDKVPGITEYGREVYDQIQERIANVAQENKPKVLILFKYSDTQFQTSGSNFFGQYWCDAAGAINVASELKGMADINMEQVYEWNPDIIYITNFSKYMPEDLYNNTTLDGHDWSGVKAVKEKRVYKYPLGMYRWYPPSSESALSLWFQAKTNYPELFKDIDLEQIVKDYYQKFYHIELTDENVHQIFNPAREAADGV